MKIHWFVQWTVVALAIYAEVMSMQFVGKQKLVARIEKVSWSCYGIASRPDGGAFWSNPTYGVGLIARCPSPPADEWIDKDHPLQPSGRSIDFIYTYTALLHE